MKWLKIARVDTKGRVLDISDPNPTASLYKVDDEKYAPKLTLNYTKYNVETNKAEAHHTHYIDLDVLDLLAWDMLTNHKDILLEEFKGGKAGKNNYELDESYILSRKLTVVYNDTLNIGACYQVFFVVTDGVVGDKGQITPLKGGKTYLKECINIPVTTARKLGKSLIRYLQARENSNFNGVTNGPNEP